MRGGSVLPALTPSRPPQPSSASASSSKMSTVRSDAAADARRRRRRGPARGEVTRRRVGQVARQRDCGRRRAAPRSTPARTAADRAPSATTRHVLAARRARASSSARVKRYEPRSDALDDGLADSLGRGAADVDERGTARLRRASSTARAAAAAVLRTRGHVERRRARRRRRPPARDRCRRARRGSGRPCPRTRAASSAARSRPSGRGTAPSLHTGTPTASAALGAERATVEASMGTRAFLCWVTSCRLCSGAVCPPASVLGDQVSAPSCQRASVHSRSDSRFRYTSTGDAGRRRPGRRARPGARPCGRRRAAPPYVVSPGTTNSVGGSNRSSSGCR